MADFSYNVDVLPVVYTPAPGPPGPSGPSAYAVAIAEGFVGNEAAWLDSLQGPSAYEVAVSNGYNDTEANWLISLEGDSAYTLAVDNGYVGDEVAWLASLIGPPGASAYQTWLQNGNTGTETDYLNSLIGKQGPSGDSAYAIAVQNGFVGNEAAWLASLHGPSGSTTWSAITGKPSLFPPSAHTHPETDVTNLVADLNNRVLTSNIVQGGQSLAGGGALSSTTLTLTLVNDAASPGASRFYATNISNVRGWIPYGTAALVNVPGSGNATNAQAVLGSDTRLADTRLPKAHAASHGSGGLDQITLLRAQISDLPGVVTTASMGFVPQLPTSNPTTLYFRGDGSYAPVTASVSSVPWSAIVGAPLATYGAPGLLRQLNSATPIPGSGSQTQTWCRGDGNWQPLPVTTYTNAAFNIPALGASTTVTVNPSPEWPQVTACVYFSDGATRGFLECSATGTGPYASVTLTNRGFYLNATPGTTVNTGAILSLRGPSVTGGGFTGLVPPLPASTPSARFLDGTGAFNLLPLATTTSPGATPILNNNANQYLNGQGAWTSVTATPPPNASAGTPGVIPTSDVQIFITPGAFTWTKPTIGNPTSVEIICIGAGAGGGGGAHVAAATAAGGGGGGGGGSYTSVVIPASVLAATVPGNVGAGGTGGVAVSTSGTAGNAGQAYVSSTHDSWFGNASYFNPNICYADGGRPGGGGAVGGVAGTAGTGGVKGQYAGSAGGAGSASGAAAGNGGQPTSLSGAGGGAGGGGFATANAESNGAAGSPYPLWIGGIGAGAGGLVHAAGSPGSAAPSSAYLPGAGGGGGGTSNTAATRGGIGGAGGNYGGGGGGGGAGDANANAVGAGAGGNGANGCVIIITYF